MYMQDAKLKFIKNLLEAQQERGIAITHSKVPYSTVYDAHIEGINSGKAGAQCHYFIDRSGAVHMALSEEFATDVAKDSIVICLEGNLEASPCTDEQRDALVSLCKKIKKDHKISTSEMDLSSAGKFFPSEDFLHEFGVVESVSEPEAQSEDVASKARSSRRGKKSRK